jgi:hypothetical protein
MKKRFFSLLFFYAQHSQLQLHHTLVLPTRSQSKFLQNWLSVSPTLVLAAKGPLSVLQPEETSQLQ